MSLLSIYILTVFCLGSCTGKKTTSLPESSFNSDSSSESNQDYKDLVNEMLDYYEFNGSWVQLYPTDSGNIRIQPCDWGIVTKWIDNNTIAYENYDGIMKFDYKVSINNGIYIYKDEITSYQYTWLDSANRIIQEKEFQNDALVRTSMYVDTIYVDRYILYEQPCEECWGEEECAYRRKLEEDPSEND